MCLYPSCLGGKNTALYSFSSVLLAGIINMDTRTWVVYSQNEWGQTVGE